MAKFKTQNHSSLCYSDAWSMKIISLASLQFKPGTNLAVWAFNLPWNSKCFDVSNLLNCLFLNLYFIFILFEFYLLFVCTFKEHNYKRCDMYTKTHIQYVQTHFYLYILRYTWIWTKACAGDVDFSEKISNALLWWKHYLVQYSNSFCCPY